MHMGCDWSDVTLATIASRPFQYSHVRRLRRHKSLVAMTKLCSARITLNGGTGGLEDRVAKWKTWIVRRCLLHRRVGQQAALQDGPVDCTLSLATEKGGPEGCSFLQPAGPPFCSARRKFTFFIWKYGPPARPARRPFY